MAKRASYTQEQKDFIKKLLEKEKCILSQVAELTGVPLRLVNVVAAKHGISAPSTRRSSIERVRLARQTADLRLAYYAEIKRLFG